MKKNKISENDHRLIGKKMGLWTFSDYVGSGLPLFTPEGTAIRIALENFLNQLGKENGYSKVTIPHIAKRKLYEISGHAQKFGDELIKVQSHFDDFVLKPVNCPHHTQIYCSELRSYRDLPVRYMESTMQYRDEQPGELAGLSRVRAITVDDGHVFCRPDQVMSEVKAIVEQILAFYNSLNLLENHWVSLSFRDNGNPDKYIGDIEDWVVSEKALHSIANEMNLNAKLCEGEAALYGPKLDFMFIDSLGRQRQLATVQIDFAMPKRFELFYTDSDGKRKTPVMIHRAILGSFERFIALLIEHYSGKLPLWLAPIQLAVVIVGELEKDEEFHKKITGVFNKSAVRFRIMATKSLGYRIHAVKDMNIPYMIVLGKKDLTDEKIWIQSSHDQSKLISCKSIEDVIRKIEIAADKKIEIIN